MIRTGTRTPEEMDGNKDPSPAVAAAIAVTIAKTSQSQNIHSKGNERWSDFQTNNYQNRA